MLKYIAFALILFISGCSISWAPPVRKNIWDDYGYISGSSSETLRITSPTGKTVGYIKK